jgi:hypothetical protein
MVVNEHGQPVEKATVYAHIIDNRPYTGLIPQTETDQTGHFAFQGLDWGQYAVFGKKEEEDYPDTLLPFYSGGMAQTVTLRPPDTDVTVTIRLGPKAGVLVGTVRDAVTGDPLNPCVLLTRVSDPNRSDSSREKRKCWTFSWSLTARQIREVAVCLLAQSSRSKTSPCSADGAHLSK